MIALARQIGTILHRFWTDGSIFTTEAPTAQSQHDADNLKRALLPACP
ncbi:hypothetical protein [Bradyrhizobium sp. USDA 10063]